MRKQSIPGCLSPPTWPGYEANYGLPTASAVGLIIGEVVGLLVIVVLMKREKFKGECCNFQLVFEPILQVIFKWSKCNQLCLCVCNNSIFSRYVTRVVIYQNRKA